MKNTIILLVTLIAFLSSCKKKGNDDITSTNNSSFRPKFKDTLVIQSGNNYNNVFATYCPFTNDFFILQKNTNNQFDFYKCDVEINNLVSKTLNLGAEELIDLKASKTENSFFTISATNNFPPQAQLAINAYSLNIFKIDSLGNCNYKIYDFQFEGAFNPNAAPSANNNSTINKFDGSGNLLWTKQLDGNYFDGNSIETDLLGNIYVLTAKKYPLTPKLSSAFSGTLVPYYEYQTDSNSFSVYKFDSNGNQIFKNTIHNVKQYDPFVFNPSITLSKTKIGVACTNIFFMFDLNGNILSQNKPIANTCYSYVNSLISSPYINRTFITGNINYSNNITNLNILGYFAFFNNTSASVVSQSNNLNYQFSAVDTLENIYLAGLNKTIKKLDSNGGIIYSNFYINEFGFSLSKKSTVIDKNNALYSFTNLIDRIAVYKFDSNGQFN